LPPPETQARRLRRARQLRLPPTGDGQERAELGDRVLEVVVIVVVVVRHVRQERHDRSVRLRDETG
jgi:hypothetical protein